ncbi:PEGA domain protein [Clostridium sp. N3C]|uniref:cohesin domain-containing protein n=1 Tax=Clostridium sp. N3C TaxID=1776758 RepID=UPI00092DF2CF|nr:cohesin domain-containing protein [Clostridium sp. N3C]SCN25713.1 PEGA domain protein [Clostridium sp. N3C]
MTKKRFLNLFSFLAPLLLLLCVAIPQFPKVVAAGNANISYSLSKSPIYVGDTFDIYVNISNVTDLYGASIDFKFDPTLFSVQDVVVGNVWNGQAQLKGFLEDQRGSGYFSYYASLSGEKAGLTNSGVLFTIKAKALKSGSMPLNTTNSDVTLSVNQQNVKIKLSNSKLSDQKIQYQATAKTISIQPNFTRIEETNYNINYSGTWGSESLSKFSGGAEKYIGSSGSLSFDFTGTGIRLISTTYNNRGIAKVTIDGTSYDVDMYSASLGYKKTVFEKTNLANGTHSIKVEYTGRKNSKSTGTYIIIDAFDIINGNIKESAKINRVDDSNPNIAYNGIWQNESHYSFNNGSETYTNSSGSLSFSFTGTGIKLISTPYNNRGIAKVIIDGIPYNVDMYSSSLGFQKTVFEKTDLTNGTHTLRVEYTGLKNANSKETYIMIDAFDIINGNIVNSSTINRIEENNENISYSSNWESESLSKFSGGAEKYIGSSGSLSFNFTGTGIRLISTPYNNRGIAKVTIDGTSYDVDMYSTSLGFQQTVFEKTNLANGTHSIKVEYTGRKNSRSSATYIMIDAFDIINGNIVTASTVKRIEENNNTITYSGTWGSESLSKFSGGVEKYAGSSASLSFNFTGTGIRLISTPYTNRGIAKVTIDGTSYDVDMYSASLGYQKTVFEKTNLPNGIHSIKVEYTGRKNSKSSSTYIMVDGFDIINGDIVNSSTVNRVEENNSKISYVGTWEFEAYKQLSAGYQKYASSATSSLSFSFSGTGIKLISSPYNNRGIAKVIIDGTSYTVDMYSPSLQLQKTIFQVTNLSPGNHTITVQCTGTKSSSSKGTYIMIDAFDIIGGNIY